MTDNDLARGRRYREAIDLSACQSMGDCAPVHAISDALATASMAVADAELAELRAQVSTLTAEVERLQNVATLNATLASRMTQRAEHAEGEASTLTAERDEARVEVERQAVLLRAIKDCHDDPARAILQADILAGEAILRREAAEAEVRDLRAEVEHWKHHAWESVERILGERIGELERENADLRAEVEAVEALAQHLRYHEPSDSIRAVTAGDWIEDALASVGRTEPEGARCPGCGSATCQWKRLECESPVTNDDNTRTRLHAPAPEAGVHDHPIDAPCHETCPRWQFVKERGAACHSDHAFASVSGRRFGWVVGTTWEPCPAPVTTSTPLAEPHAASDDCSNSDHVCSCGSWDGIHLHDCNVWLNAAGPAPEVGGAS